MSASFFTEGPGKDEIDAAVLLARQWASLVSDPPAMVDDTDYSSKQWALWAEQYGLEAEAASTSAEAAQAAAEAAQAAAEAAQTAAEAAVVGLTQSLQFAASDAATPLALGSQTGYMRAPYAFTATGARISLKTAQSSGSVLRVQIFVNGAPMLDNMLTIDNGEKTSVTSSTSPPTTFAAIPDDAEITATIDQVGIGGLGLVVTLIGMPA